MWEIEQDKHKYINEEYCKCQIIKEAKGTMGIWIYVIIICILAGAMAAFLHNQLLSDRGDISILGHPIVFFIMMIVCVGIPTLFIIMMVWLMIARIIQFMKIKRGEFRFVEDTLMAMDIQPPIVRRYHSRPERKVLYFKNAGEYVLNSLDGSVFDYSDVGDTFYMLIMNDGDVPLKIYNKKIYTYRK